MPTNTLEDVERKTLNLMESGIPPARIILVEEHPCGSMVPMPKRGERLSEEAKARLSEVMKQKWADPDSRYNSAETSDLWSKQRLGVVANPEAVARRAASNKGKKRTPEQISRIASRWTPEARKNQSEALRGQWNGRPARGDRVGSKGYRNLTGQHDHPLALGGRVLEHRKVLFDAIGPGPHLCHWGCGRLIEWGGTGGIHVDHVDGDKLNNVVSNLVPSCPSCNKNRAKEGNPSTWSA